MKKLKYKLLAKLGSGRLKRRYIEKVKKLELYDLNKSNSDINWNQFRDNVLAHTGTYKGIFVQHKTIPWNETLYQRPQHICTALAKLGYLVIYVTTGEADAVNGFRAIAPNLWLTNDEVHLNEIKGAVHSIYSTAPENLKSVQSYIHNEGVLVYEYIDHISEEISGHKDISALKELWQLAIRGKADYVVASAHALESHVLEANPSMKTLYVPNGVDVGHFQQVITESDWPEKLTAFSSKYKKIVGYFGAMAPWIWYDMINELTKARPDVGFVFIGPEYSLDLEKKMNLGGNVLWLGPVEYSTLPRYAACFDACIIPFKPGLVAQTTSPLKLFEYFALRKPVVVSSDMKECVQYEEVLSASTVEEFSQTIDEAIKLGKDNEFCERLLNLANRNSWLERAKAMESLFPKR